MPKRDLDLSTPSIVIRVYEVLKDASKLYLRDNNWVMDYKYMVISLPLVSCLGKKQSRVVVLRKGSR
jgi:hypothetical protein